MKILLAEHDPSLCRRIKQQLVKESCIVDVCSDGEEGLLLALARDNGYDLAVISRLLPIVDGLTILNILRNKKISIPVIITGPPRLQDKLDALNRGADDYLSTPFYLSELSARIHALARRPARLTENNCLSFYDLSLDLTRRQLVCKSRRVSLTPTEFHLMSAFLEKPETLLGRNQLMQKAWETYAPIGPGNLDNYMYFLRKKLRSIGSGCCFTSVYGSGYILEIKKSLSLSS